MGWYFVSAHNHFSSRISNVDKLISQERLRAGDVLLCYKAKTLDPIGNKIREVTQSNYTHAAICIDATNAVESESSLGSNGVAKITISRLLSRYDHAAVFRQPDAWSQDRVSALQTFINCLIKSGAKYNVLGVAKFRKHKKAHDNNLTEQLHAYFSGDLEVAPLLKGKYFCSELVVDCFVATGFIDPSAAVVYHSATVSPGDLGRDATFGTFCGYVTCIANYKVPTRDEFAAAATYDEIFGLRASQ